MDEVETICEHLSKAAPNDPFTTFHQAEAFHKQGRSREAFAVFQYARLEFKKGAKYFYALARYLCALDQCTLASTCIGNAVDADASIRLKALNNPELERVWLDVREG